MKIALVVATLPLLAVAALGPAAGHPGQGIGERVPIETPRAALPAATRAGDTYPFSGGAEYYERCSVVAAGDVNQDGHADFALSNRQDTACRIDSSGTHLDRVWIVSGKEGALLRTLRPPRSATSFGCVIENIGDIDSDDIPELVITARAVAWIYSGRSGNVLHELGGWFKRDAIFQNAAGGGDLDGDGVFDVALFMERALEGSRDDRRHFVVAYSGGTGRLLCLVVDNGWTGSEVFDREARTLQLDANSISRALAIAPDRDGDGRSELLVDFVSSRAAGSTLATIDAVTGAVRETILLSGNEADATHILRSLPDVSGDGLDDFLTSSIHHWTAVHCGRTGTELRRHSYRGYNMAAEGTSLCVAGDFDVDGISDYLMAAHENYMGCDPGFMLLYSGKTGEVIRTTVLHTKITDEERAKWSPISCGIDACALPDVDGDKHPDIVMSMPRTGEVWMVSGATFMPLWRAPLFEQFVAADAEARRAEAQRLPPAEEQ